VECTVSVRIVPNEYGNLLENQSKSAASDPQGLAEQNLLAYNDKVIHESSNLSETSASSLVQADERLREALGVADLGRVIEARVADELLPSITKRLETGNTSVLSFIKTPDPVNVHEGASILLRCEVKG
jgi:hypothetical protein